MNNLQLNNYIGVLTWSGPELKEITTAEANHGLKMMRNIFRSKIFRSSVDQRLKCCEKDFLIGPKAGTYRGEGSYVLDLGLRHACNNFVCGQICHSSRSWVISIRNMVV